MPSRRHFLRATVAAAGAAALYDSLVSSLAAQGCGLEPPAGTLVRTLPLGGPAPARRPTPLGTPVGGAGLDTRQFTDLSRIAPDRQLTPSDEVFVRTAPPPDLAALAPQWTVTLHGRDGVRPLPAADLARAARPMGAHVIECSGNADPDNFGLLSAAEWSGVPLADIADRLRPGSADFGLLVTGMDDTSQVARTSLPGASWVLPLADLPRLGAFLATHMNGALLPPAHGAPVRLVVPGWYGCSWIKWVRDIALVGAEAPITSQMAEFAARTHQDGQPRSVAAYRAPTIDVAAMPVRVEQWRDAGRLTCRIVGIVWGGDRPVNELAIRFTTRDRWTRFPVCPSPIAPRAWSLWSYRWQPTSPGAYDIALSCPTPGVPTRRLDLFYYVRRVRIDEV